MKNLKLKRILLFWCCFIVTLTLLPLGGTATISQAAENNKNENTMKISKHIDIPAGVEILKTLAHDDAIYAVGISSSNKAPYNLNGSETEPKIFVAKYSKDLKVESVVDTGYMFSFYGASLYHDDENQKTVAKKSEMERPLYELYFIDGKLTVVGSASDPNKTKYISGEEVLEHNVKMVVAMQYDTSLKQLQKADFGFTNYTYGVTYTSVVTDEFLYITYIPQIPGRFGPSQNEIVRYKLNDFKQKHTTNLANEKNSDGKAVAYKTMIRYKDGVALEHNDNSLIMDGTNEWDYFSKDLKNNGKITKNEYLVFKDRFANEESYSDSEVNPSFKTNSGKLYRFSRFSTWMLNLTADSTFSKKTEGVLDAAQDEKGRIVTLSIDNTLKPQLIMRGASGEVTEQHFSFDAIAKQSISTNVSNAQSKIVVVIAQKMYVFELDEKMKIEKAGEFNNPCYSEVITKSSEEYYYDAASKSCYVSQIKVNTDGNDFSIKSSILKNGQEFIDFKTSQYIKERGLFLKVTSMMMNQDGNLAISGHISLAQTDTKGTPYTAIIDQNGKIIKEVVNTTLFLNDADGFKLSPGYSNMKMIGQYYVLTGRQEVDFMSYSEDMTDKSYTLPFVHIVNKELKEIKILFNQKGLKYKNFEVESVSSVGQHYMKILLRHKKTKAIESILYSFKENKIVNAVETATTQEVESGDKVLSIVDNQIVEKDAGGNEISKRPLKLNKGQITPIKQNDHYVVSTINDQNKLEFHLIGNDGESLQTLATEFEIAKDQIILYSTATAQSSGTVAFSIVDEKGNGSQYEVDVTSLEANANKAADEKARIPFIIAGIIVVITAGVTSSVLIIRRRKKGKQIKQGNEFSQ